MLLLPNPANPSEVSVRDYSPSYSDDSSGTNHDDLGGGFLPPDFTTDDQHNDYSDTDVRLIEQAVRLSASSPSPNPVWESRPIPRKQTGYVSAGRRYTHVPDELGRPRRKAMGQDSGHSRTGVEGDGGVKSETEQSTGLQRTGGSVQPISPRATNGPGLAQPSGHPLPDRNV